MNLVLSTGCPTRKADTLFILRSVNQEQEMEEDDGEIEGHEIYHGTKFYIESAFSSFLQVYQKIEDEADTIFNYIDGTKTDFYTRN